PCRVLAPCPKRRKCRTNSGPAPHAFGAEGRRVRPLEGVLSLRSRAKTQNCRTNALPPGAFTRQKHRKCANELLPTYNRLDVGVRALHRSAVDRRRRLCAAQLHREDDLAELFAVEETEDSGGRVGERIDA